MLIYQHAILLNQSSIKIKFTALTKLFSKQLYQLMNIPINKTFVPLSLHAHKYLVANILIFAKLIGENCDFVLIDPL